MRLGVPHHLLKEALLTFAGVLLKIMATGRKQSITWPNGTLWVYLVIEIDDLRFIEIDRR
jgi:hypothetical protein